LLSQSVIEFNKPTRECKVFTEVTVPWQDGDIEVTVQRQDSDIEVTVPRQDGDIEVTVQR
jgi:hypothetical protein